MKHYNIACDVHFKFEAYCMAQFYSRIVEWEKKYSRDVSSLSLLYLKPNKNKRSHPKLWGIKKYLYWNYYSYEAYLPNQKILSTLMECIRASIFN